jgi:serine/threonine protein kinase
MGEKSTTGGTLSEKIRWEQLNLTPIPPSEIIHKLSPEIDRIVLKALSKKPSKRYKSVREFAESFGAEIAPEKLEKPIKIAQDRKKAPDKAKKKLAEKPQIPSGNMGKYIRAFGLGLSAVFSISFLFSRSQINSQNEMPTETISSASAPISIIDSTATLAPTVSSLNLSLTIQDIEGNPIQWAIVNLLGGHTSRVSDEDGYVNWESLPNSVLNVSNWEPNPSVTLEISAPGFISTVSNVSLESGKNNSFRKRKSFNGNGGG